MGTPFNLEIVTPDRIFFKGETEGIILRTTVGDKGILAKHATYTAAIGIGKVRVLMDGKYRDAAVSYGIVKVGKEKTTILADSCEWQDEIDLDRAGEARKKAEEALSASLSGRQLEIAEYKLKRALNRLSVGNNDS